VALLGYFGEAAGPCGNCDNCLAPPALWDGTEAARKALSAVYRTGSRFGAGHVVDVLRGRATDRVAQWGHERLSVFGIGAELDERQWRAVFRQLVVQGLLAVDHAAYGALKLTEASRPVLRGEVPVRFRQESRVEVLAARPKPAAPADPDLFERLRAWRREAAAARGVPAYVILHDATLREIASQRPRTLAALATVPGIGTRKLDAYGAAILAVVGQ
jgi:ATP-dependent DNA helicase RecQ